MAGSNPHDARIVAADADGIAAAAVEIGAGRAVAVPTETVYGLAADAARADAVASIYRIKGRPDFNPLIVHARDIAMAHSVAAFDARAIALAETFWPGPLTLVLPLRGESRLAAAVTAGLPTVALRVSAHPVMCALIEAVGRPLAAPSANRSGAISPTRAAHVAASLGGRVPLILDGGATGHGVESTIVAIRDGGWSLLRPGPVPREELVTMLGQPDDIRAGIEAPGQLASHYAPVKPLRLNAGTARSGEWLIGFGAVEGDDNLSSAGDLVAAAARLFDALHRADASEAGAIAVAPIPLAGVGLAINDRLSRAAAR